MFPFEARFEAVIAPGEIVTATATDLAGNTSEFSPCAVVLIEDAQPSLSAARSVRGDVILISWPASFTNFVLEAARKLDTNIFWSSVTNEPVIANDRLQVDLRSEILPSSFFRLRKR